MIVFKVGEFYSFQIFKTIDISGEEFYMLIDPNGNKYLLPAEHYINYGLKPGVWVKCRIDKINCTGKMYIEPEHPVYKENTVENFKFVSESSEINSFGENARYFAVTDIYDNKLLVPVMSDLSIPKEGSEIEMFISRIIKGIPIIFIASEFHITFNLQLNKRYFFFIEGLSTLNNKDYFRLKDQDGGYHFLRQKHYTSRNYKIGDNIFCTVIHEPNPGTYYLEPDYPDYNIGEIYEFEYLREDKHYYKDGTTEDVVIVKDSFRKECTLFVEWHTYVQADKVKAKVESVRKGKLLLRKV